MGDAHQCLDEHGDASQGNDRSDVLISSSNNSGSK